MNHDDPDPTRETESDGRTADEAVRSCLDRIARLDPSINSFVHVAGDAAKKRAAEIDALESDQRTQLALAGTPVAVKDALCTSDQPTTCGSRMLADYRPPYDAEVVSRLRNAGAIVVGKTNMDEFAMGASTETSVHGVTRNPWDLARTPGGSSGGAAACVAADLVALSIGSDTGGSIRQPAAFCGVTGLKPTYGKVSRRGLVAFASSLDQIGPLARSVAECRKLYRVIAGHDPGDSTSLPQPEALVLGKTSDLQGVRIGCLTASMQVEGVDDSIRQAVNEARRVLTDLGATLVDVELPHSSYWVPTYYVIAPSEASSNLSRFDGVHYGHRSENIGPDALSDLYTRSREEGFGDEVKRRIMIGTYALSEGYADQYYNQALRVRRLIQGDFDHVFEQVDALLGPVTPTPAFGLGDKVDDPVSMYLCDQFTVGANLAGIPALSLPGGFDRTGQAPLPVGVQLQAPAMHENRLFQIGEAFQSVTDHHRQRPSMVTDTTKTGETA